MDSLSSGKSHEHNLCDQMFREVKRTMVYVYRVGDGLDVPGVRKTMVGAYRVMDGDQHWKSEKAPHSG